MTTFVPVFLSYQSSTHAINDNTNNKVNNNKKLILY